MYCLNLFVFDTVIVFFSLCIIVISLFFFYSFFFEKKKPVVLSVIFVFLSPSFFFSSCSFVGYSSGYHCQKQIVVAEKKKRNLLRYQNRLLASPKITWINKIIMVWLSPSLFFLSILVIFAIQSDNSITFLSSFLIQMITIVEQ